MYFSVGCFYSFPLLSGQIALVLVHVLAVLIRYFLYIYYLFFCFSYRIYRILVRFPSCADFVGENLLQMW